MLFFEGVGIGEFDTKEQFEGILRRSVMSFAVHDCDANDKIISFFMHYPTPMSRSYHPLFLGKWVSFFSLLFFGRATESGTACMSPVATAMVIVAVVVVLQKTLFIYCMQRCWPRGLDADKRSCPFPSLRMSFRLLFLSPH